MAEFFFAESLVRSGSEPKLPIERLRVDGLSGPVAVIVLPPVGSHLRDSSQAASLNQIDSIAKVAPTALLHPALQNPFAGANRARQGCAFFERVSHRLLQIDVLACRQSIDCHAHVPMVRRCNDHRIHILLEHFTIIQVGSRDALGAFFDGIAMRRVDVAYGRDLMWGALVSSIEQAAHAPAGTDHSDAKRIVCTQHSSRGKRGKSGGNKEAAAI